MNIGAVEIKLGLEFFSKLLRWASCKRQSKKTDKLASDAFRELLKGDKADLDKVAGIIRKLRKSDDVPHDIVRLEKMCVGATVCRSPLTSTLKKKSAPRAKVKAAVTKTFGVKKSASKHPDVVKSAKLKVRK